LIQKIKIIYILSGYVAILVFAVAEEGGGVLSVVVAVDLALS